MEPPASGWRPPHEDLVDLSLDLLWIAALAGHRPCPRRAIPLKQDVPRYWYATTYLEQGQVALDFLEPGIRHLAHSKCPGNDRVGRHFAGKDLRREQLPDRVRGDRDQPASMSHEDAPTGLDVEDEPTEHHGPIVWLFGRLRAYAPRHKQGYDADQVGDHDRKMSAAHHAWG